MNARYTNPQNAQKNQKFAATTLAAVVTLLVVGVATAQPNLVVRVDGSVIANHTELTFDNTPVGDSRQIVVVLRNQGNETLSFTENPPIMMAGGFPEQFGLIQPALEAGDTLSPNGSTAFAVRYEPSLELNRAFTHLYVWTNASATPFHLIVSGSSRGPKMVVLHENVEIPDLGVLEFPETEIGQTSEVTLRIENQGAAPLELTGDPRAQIFGGFDFDFTVTQLPEATVAAGAATEMRIAFTPTLERVYSTRLFIDVNEDSARVNTLYDIDVLAAAIAPPVQEDPNDASDDAPGQDPNDAAGDPSAGDDPADGNADEPTEPVDEPANNDPNQAGLDNPGSESDDPAQDAPVDEEIDEVAEIEEGLLLSPVPTCGFGAGFASLMGLVSLGGVRRYGYRPVK